MTFLTHLTDAQLQRFVSGDLVEVEATAARAHLDDCGQCRRRASEVSALFAVLAEPPRLPEPPIDFLAAVMARVEREAPAPVLFSRKVALAGFGAGSAVLAAGAALVVTGGAGAHVPAMASQLASTIAGIAGHAGLALTVLRAGAPVLGAAATASLAVLAPIFWKTISSLQPNAIRVTARS